MADYIYIYIFRVIMKRTNRKALVIFPTQKNLNKIKQTQGTHTYREKLYLVEIDTAERRKKRKYRETDTLYCSTN